jgi:hypothetical protein
MTGFVNTSLTPPWGVEADAAGTLPVTGTHNQRTCKIT